MARVPEYFFEQSGVIPFRVQDGEVQVLLITSIRRGRWIVPKGVIESDLSAEESALCEAEEEAGVTGEVLVPAVGSYEYNKWGGTCRVEVFLLEVHEVHDTWPEEADRRRKWFSCSEAGKRVSNSGLGDLIADVPASLKRRGRLK